MESTLRLPEAIEVLGRTPAAIAGMLSGLGQAWTHANYGEATFSPFDVVGHLIHGEKTDWIPRLRIILEHGEGRPFDPFDRFAQTEASRGKTMQNLLDEFARLRAENLSILRALRLTEAQLSRTGMHPALGRVTASELIATWVVHDLNHLKQIAKAMSHQYRDLVGPWREYLPILTRP
ncbi:MAG: DinB family protein [Planctomycetota bacterium]